MNKAFHEAFQNVALFNGTTLAGARRGDGEDAKATSVQFNGMTHTMRLGVTQP